jgi:hypothetical protein
MGGVGKKLITKTWMAEMLFVQGHIPSVAGDALLD